MHVSIPAILIVILAIFYTVNQPVNERDEVIAWLRTTVQRGSTKVPSLTRSSPSHAHSESESTEFLQQVFRAVPTIAVPIVVEAEPLLNSILSPGSDRRPLPRNPASIVVGSFPCDNGPCTAQAHPVGEGGRCDVAHGCFGNATNDALRTFVYYNERTPYATQTVPSTEPGRPPRNVADWSPPSQRVDLENLGQFWQWAPSAAARDGVIGYYGHKTPSSMRVNESLNLDAMQAAWPPYLPGAEASAPNISQTPVSSSMIWMSAASGVVAHDHFDLSGNWYIQLYGSKRFLLTPPQAFHSYCTYPSLHPSSRQSQRPTAGLVHSQGDGVRLTGVCSSPIRAPQLSVDLHPGQMLFIPPHWFHRVESLSPSISLNVWTTSRQYALYKEATRVPIPLNGAWPKGAVLLGARLYIEALLDAMGYEPAEFVGRMLHTQFEPLIARTMDSPLATYAASNECAFPQGQVDEMRDATADLFAPSLRKHVAIFTSMKDLDYSVVDSLGFVDVGESAYLGTAATIADIHLGIYVQLFSDTVLDTVQTYFFFAKCFPGAWEVATMLARGGGGA